ncbi:MAG: LTA synthase family protein [Betaproteobacteria bacterium]|nr:LTA synthase family protein [Betaproteobacteria bacterium]
MSVLVRRIHLGGYLLRVFGLLCAYALTRILFFQFNKSTLEIHSNFELLSAFLLGLRFDVWVVFASMLPLFFLEVAGLKSKSTMLRRFNNGYAWFVLSLHAVFLFFEISDCEYFRFTGRRTTLGILSLSSDALQQSTQLLFNYWHVPALTLALVAVLAVLWGKTRQADSVEFKPVSTAKVVFITLAGICIGVLGLRGGLQTKPIAPAHAMQLGNSKLAALALSTSFQLTHSFENRELKKLNFFSSSVDARKILELPQGEFAPMSLKGSNVVVLIVESLSQEYMGYLNPTSNFTPFVNELAKKSLYFNRAYANGRQSIDALPSMFATLPSVVGEPFITSQYSSVQIPGLGKVLAENGYATAFFHGAKNGSMHIDSMAQLFGFQKYFGKSQYPAGDKDFDGSWGIYDEPFLQFALEKIDTFAQPFALGVFTLSSHNPYRIPDYLKAQLPEGRHPFHRSLAYADYALRKFFEEAEKKPWYKNTLFVITGDHTSEPESELFKQEQSIYRVPLMFFDPSGRIAPALSQRLVQHADIFPTLVDLLDLQVSSTAQAPLPFGQNVFLPEQYARAANRAGDWFWYQEGHFVARTPADGSGAAEIVEIQSDTLTPGQKLSADAPQHDFLLQRARAYLHLYTNGLIENNLVVK